MIKENIIKFYKRNTGSVCGALIGLVISVLILTIGLFKTMFITLFVVVGYYAGNKIYNDKDCIKKFLDRILPPGTYR